MDFARRTAVKVTPVTSKSGTKGTRSDNANQPSSRQSAVGTKSTAPPMKKDILINTKVNPTAIKIRSNQPVRPAGIKIMPSVSSRSGDTGSCTVSETPSLHAGATHLKPIKLMPDFPAAAVDGDEEILDELYAMYLQRRLLAQYAHKKMRQELTSQTDETTELFLKKELVQKNVFEARFHSLRRIEKQVAQLEKMKSLEENCDLLLELILNNNAEQCVQNFEDKLSAMGDVLRVTSSTHSNISRDQQLNFAPVEEAYQELIKSAEISDSALHVIENLSNNLETLQGLSDTLKCDEKELNDKIVQLASLKASQDILYSQPEKV